MYQSIKFSLVALLLSATLSCISPPISVEKQETVFVLLRAGSFEMGSEHGNESPVHKVNLTKDFMLQEHETTVEQLIEIYNIALDKSWAEIEDDGIYLANGPRLLRLPHEHLTFIDGKLVAKEGDALKPIMSISWYGAVAWCNWKSQLDGLELVYDLDTWQADFTTDGYRLPSEAEFEYAARGGQFKNEEDIGPNNLDDYAWSSENSREAQPVKMKKSTKLGLYDILGNAWEWVHDYFAAYSGSVKIDPMGPVSGLTTVFRGGGWGNDRDSAMPSARNGYSDRSWCDNSVGFRPARTVILKK